MSIFRREIEEKIKGRYAWKLKLKIENVDGSEIGSEIRVNG